MTQPIAINSVDGLSRRSLLKTTAAGSVGLAVGTGIASAGRGGGGRGFITSSATALLDAPFTITDPVPDGNPWVPTDIAPSCNGRSKPQPHVPYMTDRGPWIFFPADRQVNLDNEYEVVRYTDHCGDVPPIAPPNNRHWIKVVTKPAR